MPIQLPKNPINGPGAPVYGRFYKGIKQIIQSKAKTFNNRAPLNGRVNGEL